MEEEIKQLLEQCNIAEFDPNKCYLVQMNVGTFDKETAATRLRTLCDVFNNYTEKCVFAPKYIGSHEDPPIGEIHLTELDPNKVYKIEVEVGDMKKEAAEELIIATSKKLKEHGLWNTIVVATNHGVPAYRFLEGKPKKEFLETK